MNNYIAIGIIALAIAGLVIAIKKKKVKEDDKPESADTILPTPPKPPKGEEPK